MSTLTAAAGQLIPFSLQPTLGGKSAIRSVHEDRLGSDGTDATLRGYRDLRFRDRNLLLLQAEYRVPLWGPIDGTLFADAGKVARTRSELDLSDLRRDVGFSLSIMKGWSTWARVDVGFGSGEGTRVFFTLGDLTP
jgi:outer membrane protein assembly factor BamA